MDPNNVSLENLNKLFEYEKLARDIDSISNLDELKNITKCYIKLYLKQQEIVAKL